METSSNPSNYVPGPTFGGVLYDAITFRWAIFLIIIGEFISLVRLIKMTELLRLIFLKSSLAPISN